MGVVFMVVMFVGVVICVLAVFLCKGGQPKENDREGRQEFHQKVHGVIPVLKTIREIKQWLIDCDVVTRFEEERAFKEAQ